MNLPCNILLTIYKSFIRPHVGNYDILYGKPNNEHFQNKMEYRASLAIADGM